jgi:hypothetical protein
MYAAERKIYLLLYQVGKIVQNIFASYVIKGDLKASTMKSGIEYMVFLSDWYPKNSSNGIGFFK